MKKVFIKKESKGLPGGPNEVFTYVTGVFSLDGYRENSKDVNKDFNIIPSGNITMKEKNGDPLRKGPILGIDNLGNKKAMIPGNDYSFPGDFVFEIPMLQNGGEETSWTDYFNPMNWGVSSYDKKGSFGAAFNSAKKDGKDEFMWKGNRYTTKLKEEPQKIINKPVNQKLQNKGLDPALLLRQAYRESTFNPKAVSQSGYKGLTQIGDDVIADYKKAKNIKGEVDPFDPKTAVAIQRFTMDKLYNASFINKPNQSEEIRLAKTLAAYNWGRGNLSNYLERQKQQGVDIYNSLAWTKALPGETRKYIEDILLKKNQTFNNDFNSAINNSKYKPYVNLYRMKEGGEKNELLKIYADYINGIDESEEAKTVYNKLNKVYYNEAKQNKMSVPNYILTKVIRN